MYSVANLIVRFGKRGLVCLLSFTCNHVVSVQSGFLLVLGMGCVILIAALPGPSISLFCT